MSSANTTSLSTNDRIANNLNSVLGRFVRRSHFLSIAKYGLIGLVSWLALTMVVLAVDQLSDFPSNLRWALSRGGLLIAVVGTLFAILRSQRANHAGRLARWLDGVQSTGGEFTTAWDLARALDRMPSKQSLNFAQRAIQSSMAKLDAILPAHVMPLGELKPLAYGFLGVVAVAAMATLVAPMHVWTQLRRFAFPYADIQPFNGISIYLDQSEYLLRYGDDCKILATVSRKPTERLVLIATSADGTSRTIPMLPRGEMRWQALLTQVNEPASFIVRSARTQSETGRLTVQMTPKIEDVRVRITPPTYTRQAIYEGKMPDSGIAGLAGTEVEFIVRSNRPLLSGQLRQTFETAAPVRDAEGDSATSTTKSSSESVLSLTPIGTEEANQRTVIGKCSIERDSQFEIKVTDVDGLESTESAVGKLQLLTDQRPIVRILEPRPVSLATPDIDLPVMIAAEDDFGISMLRFYRSLNGSPNRSIDLPVDGSSRANASVNLPLKRFGLAPGDEIVLFARTEDNDPIGPKGSESPLTKIRIISIAEFQERMLEQRGAEALAGKYETAQRHLESVATSMAEAKAAADRASADPENQDLQKELQQKLEEAQRAAEESARALQNLAENPMDLDVDRELSKMLQEMAEETRNLAEQFQKMAESQAGQRPLNDEEAASLEQMREQIQSDREEIQNEAIEPLNELAKKLPLMQAQEEFEQLVERQKELAQKIQSLADADANDPSNERRMMELEATQEEVRQELNELAQKLMEQAADLPESSEFESLKQSANALAQSIQESGAPNLMNEAQKSLLKSKYGPAAVSAQAAADALESLQAENHSMGEQAEQGAMNAFQKPGQGAGDKLGKTLDQLKQRMGRKGNKNGKSSLGGKEGDSGEQGGQGNGFSTRPSSSQKMGMYGSMPTHSPSSRGRSDKRSQGGATQSTISKQDSGKQGNAEPQSSDAAGQSLYDVPNSYRQRVSDYYRRIQERLQEK